MPLHAVAIWLKSCRHSCCFNLQLMRMVSCNYDHTHTIVLSSMSLLLALALIEPELLQLLGVLRTSLGFLILAFATSVSAISHQLPDFSGNV